MAIRVLVATPDIEEVWHDRNIWEIEPSGMLRIYGNESYIAAQYAPGKWIRVTNEERVA